MSRQTSSRNTWRRKIKARGINATYCGRQTVFPYYPFSCYYLLLTVCHLLTNASEKLRKIRQSESPPPSSLTLELLSLFEGQLNMLVHVELVVENELNFTLFVQNVSLTSTEDEEVLRDAYLIPDIIVLVNDESLRESSSLITSVVPHTDNLRPCLLELIERLVKESALLLTGRCIISSEEIYHGSLPLQAPLGERFRWECIANLMGVG
jgi:hypothetical protein